MDSSGSPISAPSIKVPMAVIVLGPRSSDGQMSAKIYTPLYVESRVGQISTITSTPKLIMESPVAVVGLISSSSGFPEPATVIPLSSATAASASAPAAVSPSSSNGSTTSSSGCRLM